MTAMHVASMPDVHSDLHRALVSTGSIGTELVSSPTFTSTDGAPNISAWGKALSSAYERAIERDQRLPPSELKGFAERIDRKLIDCDWDENWASLVLERPIPADTDRMKLSQDVSAFMRQFNAVSGRGTSIRNDNPFLGLDRETLLAIRYDESGAFTTNERRAAFIEANRQYSAWAEDVCERMANARDRQESVLPIYQEILAYYETLSPIEAASVPDDYVERLRDLVNSPERPDVLPDDPRRIMPLLLQWLDRQSRF